MLNKKFMTKIMMNDEYRNSYIKQHLSLITNTSTHIMDYAYHVVNSQILNRDKNLESDKKSFYGFIPVVPIGSIKKDNSCAIIVLEMKYVNHFLQKHEGNNAVDVMKCFLAQMMLDDRTISCYDVEKIERCMNAIEAQHNIENEDKPNDKH